jgi:hypothetical protein
MFISQKRFASIKTLSKKISKLLNMLMLSFFKINRNFNLNRKNRRFESRQRMKKAKNDNVNAKSCMTEEIVNI